MFSKVFEKALLLRADPWLQSGVIDQRQGGNIKNCSSLHTSLLLQETIAHNTERDSTMYVAYLDTKKAFDTVWTQGLFYKLFQAGMDSKLWRVMNNYYTDFQCRIRSGNELSA